MIICCVLKSGGDYDERYVRNLFYMIQEKRMYFSVVCFTDFPRENFKIGDSRFTTSPLLYNYPGWWSKFEIFCLTGTVIYFDLDTVILSHLYDMLDIVRKLKPDEFVGVKAFNPKRKYEEKRMFNSGVMAWNGDFKFILKQFDYKKMSENNHYIGDQDWIHEILRDNKKIIKFWQDEGIGLYSYRRHCQKQWPEDAQIICFHGHPRPHEVVDNVPWVKENWDIGEKYVRHNYTNV